MIPLNVQAEEVHPNAHGNGNETGEFMKNNFGLNVQVTY